MSQYVDINPLSSRKIPVLAFGSFAMGTEAQVYAAYLQDMAADLHVTLARIGMLGAAFAITYAITAPFAAILTARLDRRTLIVSGLVVVAVLNALGSLTPCFGVLLAIRIGCGLAAAAIGPATSAAAAALAPPEKRGRAMAIVLAGMTLAFVLGIPIGSTIGAFGGWRATFLFASAIALAAAIVIAALLPSIAPPTTAAHPSFGVLKLKAVRRGLAATGIGFAATFTAIAYVAPIADLTAHLSGAQVGALQMLIGFGSIVGVLTGLRAADSNRRWQLIAVTFIASAAALSFYSLIPMVSPPRTIAILVLSVSMMTGSAALFSRTPMIQAQLVRSVPAEATTLALGLNGSMVFAGQGLGAAAGAATIAFAGIPSLGFAAGTIALLGIALAAPGPLFLGRRASLERLAARI